MVSIKSNCTLNLRGEMGRVSRYKRLKSHDPFYRGPRKYMKGVNLRPENENDQPVPKSLIRFMKRAEMLKNSRTEKRQKPTHSDPTESTAHGETSARVHTAKEEAKSEGVGERRTKQSPMFSKRKGESLKSYLERVDVEANARVMEAHRKNRKPSERRKRYLDERWKKAVARRKGLSHEEFTDLKDEVKFGEVVSAPPQLQAKPRGCWANPSHPKSLLLHQKVSSSSQGPATKPTSTRPPVVGLRRKQDLEIERERVINVYRRKKKAAIVHKNGVV